MNSATVTSSSPPMVSKVKRARCLLSMPRESSSSTAKRRRRRKSVISQAKRAKTEPASIQPKSKPRIKPNAEKATKMNKTTDENHDQCCHWATIQTMPTINIQREAGSKPACTYPQYREPTLRNMLVNKA